MGNGKTVTAIKSQQKSRNRVSLFLDGKFTIGISISVLEKSGIHTGQSLSESEVENLKSTEQNQRAMDRALQYLSYRPRSEFEVRSRLRRYGYTDEVIATTLARLRNAGYVDDASFATGWKENRANFSSRSSRLVARELKQKGIDSEAIATTIGSIDDETEAYRAGQKKAHSLNNIDYHEFRRKLGAFLRRRGFDYEIIAPLVDKLWEEKSSEDNK
jgi:regulatory protein